MFDLERQFSSESAGKMVSVASQRRTAEDRRRDVFETHRHRVFAVSYYMTANEIEAETILTGTFVRAFGTHQEPDAGSVDRALLGELQQRFSLEPEEPAVADASLALAHMGTRRTDMEEALRVLPPAERLIFLLRDVEGYPAAKIAILLEKPEPEIQRTLFSARIRMRNALAETQVARSAYAKAYAEDLEANLQTNLVEAATESV